MLISPPRLNIPQGENESYEEWLNHFMPSTARGGFPIGSYGQWHLGLHLTNIVGSSRTGEIDIYAIADGIVMISQNSGDIQPDVNKDAEPGATYRRVNSRGVVVLRHETEIGEGDEGKIVYYSVYHHLGIISEKAQKLGMPIYRKELIGYPGRVGAQPGIHMEIFCTETNLKKITGRISGDLDYRNKNGRMNIIYGDVHFYIPAKTNAYTFTNDIPPLDKAQPTSGGVQIGVELFLTMCFAKGQVELHTRIKVNNEYIEILPVADRRASGRPPANTITNYSFGYHDYEYDMYLLVRELQRKHPENACSSIYELLRFGRVINKENEANISVNVPHWHLITMPDKSQKWVNLHQADIKVFSDGDFPQWMGWKFIDGTKDATSQCTNPEIMSILQKDGQIISKNSIAEKLTNSEVNKKFSKMICKRHSEWNENHIMKMEHWRIIKSTTNPEPMTANEYNGNFKSDSLKLCFWRTLIDRNNTIIPSVGLCSFKIKSEDVITKKYKHSNGQLNEAGQKLAASIESINTEIKNYAKGYSMLLGEELFFFNPASFIAHFHKNTWLSNHELAQLIPRVYYSYNASNESKGLLNYSTPLHRICHILNRNHAFNKMVRKYGLVERVRFSHLLAQELTEMFMASTTEEIGRGRQQLKNGNLVWPQPAMEYYQSFYGRGHMQLTWPGNYEKYGNYRSKKNLPDNTKGIYADERITTSSTHYWGNPKDEERRTNKKAIPKQWYPRYDPAQLVEIPYNSADSGGWYWVSKTINGKTGQINISRHADRGLSSDAVGRVSVMINGGGNGYFDRQGFATFLANFLLNGRLADRNIIKHITRNSGKNLITKSITVDFSPQRNEK
ncbi:hypothetical protein [Aquitalea denitrificans]|uniref:hypothetical protein n=1 Tax=Aquitalea denitrificans TaxID=519081 RepID=UPI001359A1C6|nr:hypothetical protein [Aquitalea denitrificans]